MKYKSEIKKIRDVLMKNTTKSFTKANLARLAKVNPDNISKRIYDLREGGYGIDTMYKNGKFQYQAA